MTGRNRAPVALFAIVGTLLLVTASLAAAVGHSAAAGLNGTWAKTVSGIYRVAIDASDLGMESRILIDNEKFL